MGAYADLLPDSSDSANTSSSVARSSGNQRVDAFVEQYRPIAERVAEQTGNDPELYLAKWGLETGWGKSIIPGTNNLGNIKDFSGSGVSAKDNATGSVDRYRQYKDANQFADDYASLLNRRYKNALNVGSDMDTFATELERAGYAEDPNYVSKLKSAYNMLGGSAAQSDASQPSPNAHGEYEPRTDYSAALRQFDKVPNDTYEANRLASTPKGMSISKEISAAIDSYQANLWSIPAAMGSEYALNAMLENKSAAEQQWADSGAPQSFSEMEFGKNFGQYFAHMAIQSAPYMLEFIASGFGVGSLAKGALANTAKGVAEKAAIEAAKQGATKEAAKKAGEVAAKEFMGTVYTASGVAGSYPSAVGDVLSNQYEESGKFNLPAAAALGVPYAALNAAGAEGMLTRGLARGLPKTSLTAKGAAGFAGRAALTGAEAGVMEGSTETGQEVMNQLGRMAVNPDAKIDDKRALEAYKESFIAGTLLGGVTGAVAGGFRKPEDANLQPPAPVANSPLSSAVNTAQHVEKQRQQAAVDDNLEQILGMIAQRDDLTERIAGLQNMIDRADPSSEDGQRIRAMQSDMQMRRDSLVAQLDAAKAFYGGDQTANVGPTNDPLILGNEQMSRIYQVTQNLLNDPASLDPESRSGLLKGFSVMRNRTLPEATRIDAAISLIATMDDMAARRAAAASGRADEREWNAFASDEAARDGEVYNLKGAGEAQFVRNKLNQKAGNGNQSPRDGSQGGTDQGDNGVGSAGANGPVPQGGGNGSGQANAIPDTDAPAGAVSEAEATGAGNQPNNSLDMQYGIDGESHTEQLATLSDIAYEGESADAQNIIDTLGDVDLESIGAWNDEVESMRALGFTEEEINEITRRKQGAFGAIGEEAAGVPAGETQGAIPEGDGNGNGQAEGQEGFSLNQQTNTEAAAEYKRQQEEAGKKDKEPEQPTVTADQGDLLNTQGSLFNSNRDGGKPTFAQFKKSPYQIKVGDTLVHDGLEYTVKDSNELGIVGERPSGEYQSTVRIFERGEELHRARYRALYGEIDKSELPDDKPGMAKRKIFRNGKSGVREVHEVDAQDVAIAKLPDLKFFVFKDDESGSYSLTEASTGLRVGVGETAEAAIADFESKLEKVGAETVAKHVASSPKIPGADGAKPTTPQPAAKSSVSMVVPEQKQETKQSNSEFTHNGVRIYPIAVNVGGEQKQMWGVESSENKAKREAGQRYGFGDSLLDTKEQAIAAADRQISDDEATAKYEDAKKSKEAEDAKRRAEIEADTYNGFLDGQTPAKKGLIRKALAKQWRFDGVAMTSRERIESLLAKGELEVDSYEEDKIKPMSRTQFNRASQREQDAHEKKVREGGKVTVYTVSGSDLGKIAHDYASFLLSQQKADTATKAEEQAAPVSQPENDKPAYADDAELQDALSHLGDVLGDVFGAKLNITGKQYGASDLLPAMSKVIELLIKKGFKSFRESVGAATNAMRGNANTKGFVDQITPRQWKAAYNSVAEFHEGTDSEEDVAKYSAEQIQKIIALPERIKEAEQATNHDATPGQKEAGNYAKGKFAWHGLNIAVETAKGEDRTDKETNGEKWRVTMPATYGYILGTVGADKDHVDVFMGDKPESQRVYVVNQTKPGSTEFDEHKIMLGYESEGAAIDDYLLSFSDTFGVSVLGSVSGPYAIDDFKHMLESNRFSRAKPISDRLAYVNPRVEEKPVEQQPPGVKTNGTKEKAAAERLAQLLDKMDQVRIDRNTPEGSAKGIVRSVIEELRKERTAVSVVELLETASQRLLRQHAPFSEVIDQVVESLRSDVSPDNKGDIKQADVSLDKFGLSVRRSQTKNGTPTWEVSGNTRDHVAVLRNAGGKWYGPKKVWSFYSEESPEGKILAALGASPDASEIALSDIEVERKSEGTGRIKTYTQRADEALSEIDERMSLGKQLLECLNS